MKFPFEAWFDWKTYYPTLLGLRQNPTRVKIIDEHQSHWVGECLENPSISGLIRKEAVIIENLKPFSMKTQVVKVSSQETIFP